MEQKVSVAQTRKIIIGVIGGIVFAIFLACMGSIVENLSADEIVINQVPITGTLEFWVDPGWKFQMFGDITPYDKTFQIWFSSNKKMGSDQDDSIKIVFNDAGIGNISGSSRIRLPIDSKHLKSIHEEFGSMSALIHDLIMPTINKVVFSSGPLMSSFESYAAKKNDLIRYIEDQLRHGIYKTVSEEVTKVDILTGKKKAVTMAKLVLDKESPGGFVRQEDAPFAKYGIEVLTVAVEDIVYEKKIMEQIANQQKAFMDVQTAIAQAKKAKQDAIKAEAEGKAVYQTAKWEQEKINAKDIAKAEKDKAVSKLDMEKAKYQKQADILEGEGIATKKRLIMQADGALSVKLKAYVEVSKLYAEAIANYKGAWVPTTLISSGKGNGRYNGAQDLINMLMIKTSQDLSLKANPGK